MAQREVGTLADRLSGIDLDQPIGMLNLIRFREQAEYAPDSGEQPCSGSAAYDRYRENVAPLVSAVGGRPMLTAAQHLIGSAGEWDLCFVVYYPSARAFLSMANNPSYQAVAHHRAAAVADSRATLMQFNDETLVELVATPQAAVKPPARK